MCLIGDAGVQLESLTSFQCQLHYGTTLLFHWRVRSPVQAGGRMLCVACAVQQAMRFGMLGRGQCQRCTEWPSSQMVGSEGDCGGGASSEA